ncbi:MAG TPA: inositol monophosphatase family protein [Alphaproteobacteria bacterium]|nr:inositol monophosphatase family protein [Alphaproteobacteria bacterium]
MIDKVEALLREAAARAILPRFQRLQHHEIEEKSPGELVTAADREAEHIISAGLKALRPAALVVGEEAAALDPGVMTRLLGEDEVWLIDPLDGTAHFAAGREPFAVMVALVHRRETVLSWMLDPVADAMRLAERGAGAFADGMRVRAAAACPPLGALRGAILKRFMTPEDRAKIAQRESMIGTVLSGFMCAGREYPAVVAGEQHFALFQRMLPWDHAPGVLFAEEAGAMARRLDGSPYVPGDQRRGLLVAQNAEVWQLVRETVLADLS